MPVYCMAVGFVSVSDMERCHAYLPDVRFDLIAAFFKGLWPEPLFCASAAGWCGVQDGFRARVSLKDASATCDFSAVNNF